jgi:hypothetical protein
MLRVWELYPSSVYNKWDLVVPNNAGIEGSMAEEVRDLELGPSPTDLDMDLGAEMPGMTPDMGMDHTAYHQDLETIYSQDILSTRRNTSHIRGVLYERFGLILDVASTYAEVYIREDSKLVANWTRISRSLGCRSSVLDESKIKSLQDLFNIIIMNHASPKHPPGLSDLVAGNLDGLRLPSSNIHRVFGQYHPRAKYYVVNERLRVRGTRIHSFNLTIQ